MKSVHLPRHEIDADLPRNDNVGGLFNGNIFGNNVFIFGNNGRGLFGDNDAGGLFGNNRAGGLFGNNHAGGLFGNNDAGGLFRNNDNDNNNRWIGEEFDPDLF